jgi:hypothetical protein
MSTKFFKGKNKMAKEVKPVIRSVEEINKEYTELIGQAGIEQFKLYLAEENLKRLNGRLHLVNMEANERGRLDQEAKATEANKEEIK